MSATTLAPAIVRTVRDEPSVLNAEEVVRNMLIEFANEVEFKTRIKMMDTLAELLKP